MFKKYKISTQRAIELEKWLLENYQKYENEQFIDSNFNKDENYYLQEAYRVPLWDIAKELSSYNQQPSYNQDVLKLVDDLCRRYKVDSSTILKRVHYCKAISTYLKKHPDTPFPIVHTYNELVRDELIPTIEHNRAKAIYHTLNDEDYQKELNKKLTEGYLKVISSKSTQEKIDGLTEMLEIIELIGKHNGKYLVELFDEIESKQEKQGGYTKKLYLSRTWKKK